MDKTRGENAGKHKINVTDYSQIKGVGRVKILLMKTQTLMENYFINCNILNTSLRQISLQKLYHTLAKSVTVHHENNSCVVN